MLSFPSSPRSGQSYAAPNGQIYVYDGVKWLGTSVTGGGGTTTVTNNIENPFTFSVAADDSTQREVSSGEVIKFIGSGSITTASDAEGNITITGSGGGGSTAWADITGKPTIPTLTSQLTNDSGFLTSVGTISYNDLSDKPNLASTYQFFVAADDSTQRLISTDELIKFTGAGGITTSSDAEGYITITQGTTSSLVNGVHTASLGATGILTLSNGAIATTVDNNATVNTSATVTTNNSYTNTVDFSTDVDPGVGYAIAGWYQRNSEQIEFALFGPSAFQTYLIGLALGRTVIVTYSTGSGNQTLTRTLTQAFAATGQSDPANPTWGRVSGRVDATLPADQTGIVSINFPVYSTSSKTWTFGTGGSLTFPDNTISTGKGITVPVNESITVNLPYTAFGGGTRTFKINPQSIKLPNSNGVIFAGDETAANEWNLDSGNKLLSFPDAGDGVYPKILYSEADNVTGMELLTFAKSIKITAASNKSWTFGTDGSLTLPGDIKSEGNINIDINLSDSTLRRWSFGEDGDFNIPGIIRFPNGVTIENSDSSVSPVFNNFTVKTKNGLGETRTMDFNGTRIGTNSDFASLYNQNSFGIGVESTLIRIGDLGGTSYLDTKFGVNTRTGNQGDVQFLTPVTGSGSSITVSPNNSHHWNFGSQGLLSLGESSGGIHANQTTGRITIGDSLGPTGTLSAPSTGIMIGGEDYVFEISQYAPEFPPVWRFGKDRSLNIPGSITSSSEINVEINLTDSTMRRWTFGEDGDTVIPGDIKSDSGINIEINLADSTLRRWQFGEDGNFETPGDITALGTITGNILKIEDGVHEKFQPLADATGTVTHDCSLGHIFYHTSPDANWTANFTNLNLAAGYATTVSIVIVQGGTGYYPNAVQIGGSAQTINWQGNTTPTVSTNRTDVASFSIINNSGTYVVLGQITGF